jgi:N-acetylglutamate synthase-like GNAT family acetyltransferase
MNPKQQSATSCGDLALKADKVGRSAPRRTTGRCGAEAATGRMQSHRSSVAPNALGPRAELKPAVTITRASAEDLIGVLSLLKSLQLPTAGVADHFGNFFVAKENERLAGAIGLERYGTLGLLRSAAVAPRLQKSGVGSKLTRLLIAFAKAEGLTELVLFTPTAGDFFARFGFVPANRENYHSQLKASAQWGDCSCRNSAEFMRLGLYADASDGC